MRTIFLLSSIFFFLFSCIKDRNRVDSGDLVIDSVTVNDVYVLPGGVAEEIDFRKVDVKIFFRNAVDSTRLRKSSMFFTGNIDTLYKTRFIRNTILEIIPDSALRALSVYRFIFDAGPNLGGRLQQPYSFTFYTSIDSSRKFPAISDDSLITLVQKQTARYFWDYAQPVSGLARERYGSGDLVTTGGSGFGMMALITSAERGFITRQQAFSHFSKQVNFLLKCDRFHGAFPHWINGATGKVYPFSQKDNGGDLVETAFLVQGLLTIRQYFRNGTPEEQALCDSINKIWAGVEWDWYRNNQNRLFWHWSPEYQWQMNMPVTGWNEALIVYVLAAASPTHAVPVEVYDEGWARNGTIKNGKTFYNIRLPLGEDYGGPLFFAHYSFMGLDPRKLYDKYAIYWEQNTAHALINYNYCVQNPASRRGYSQAVWGLTASDIPGGYSASSPRNDLGVIAPTAALSSMPYTPVESMRALKFFYYVLGDKLWGEYGFRDAFSLEKLWFADSWLAIDEGPIIVMIENFRSGLLWNLFMSSEEIRNGLVKLQFSY
ncbi:MAG TPA: glucoamylase family protein [Bacteroidales bacterium]|nr:glucoamylase family protein [Bacteroidales bacterium]